MLDLQYLKNSIEAGCDEAGRGCLAGPVAAAAVILPSDFTSNTLTDSKQLTAKKREILRFDIEQNALAYAVAFVTPCRIDEINILNASIEAMHLALDKLILKFEHIIVDGNRFKSYKKIPHKTIIKGDAKYLNIAAASVLAKTYRDEYMTQLHSEYPMYQWNKNYGYPTKTHRMAIGSFGECVHHRKCFRLLAPAKQLRLDI